LQPHPAAPRRPWRPAGTGWLFVVVALVLGAVGTEGYQHVRAAFGAGATDNQATAVYQGLRSQLTVAAFSGGQI